MTSPFSIGGVPLVGDRPQAHNLGAVYMGNGQCQFTVWAPRAQQIDVRISDRADPTGQAAPGRVIAMERDERGYFRALVGDVKPGDLYVYRLDDEKERPDPASRRQPLGVHKPSQVVDTHFAWQDQDWKGLSLESYIVYELHVGTFTRAGTFSAILHHLDMLKELGVNAIEIMPVAQFPGGRNWGYDGVYPFAVQQSYGGPDELKRLVNACHQQGIAVVLDVVYNHLGPDGNYLWDYGYYFTERYHTPWGSAVNFDGEHSDEVRRYFIENALYWVTEFHIDALRLDAVHAIMDFSAQPFLDELTVAVHQQADHLKRNIHLIAESDLNDTRIIRPRATGGFNMDSQWSDDFHHAVHALLTGESSGYYADYGSLEHLARVLQLGYVYAGDYSPYRQRRHGNSPHEMDASKFVVCVQNHDQVGNRMLGERLTQLVSFEQLKLAAGLLLLSPFIPMLFMGEEYGEDAPFQYFVSHLNADLVEAVRTGRKEEFSSFAWEGDVPDPQAEKTFVRSQLNHQLRHIGHHRVLFDLYKELIRLRTTLPPLATLSKEQMQVETFEEQQVLSVRRWQDNKQVFVVYHFGEEATSIELPIPEGKWRKLFDSADESWQESSNGTASATLPQQLTSKGTGSLNLAAKTFALFERVT
jgi:maltooligosyltrehalose trehalohydrolase